MAVLGNLGTMFVRDKNGQMVPVPVIRGEDGGFYTPEIKDGVIRWAASRPDMPEVPDMNIGTGGGGGTPDAVQFVPQKLTDKQQAQARENIGAARTYTLKDGETIDDAPEDADIVWDPENEGEGAGTGGGGTVDLTEVNERIDALEDEIADLKESGTGGGGLTTNAITLLTDVLRHALYLGDYDSEATITALAAELAKSGSGSGGDDGNDDVSVFTINYNLTNTVCSVNTSTISAGSAFSATISAEDGYNLSEVTVTMGGKDVTAYVYADGVISIGAVTGNIVITANSQSNTVILVNGSGTSNMAYAGRTVDWTVTDNKTVELSNFTYAPNMEGIAILDAPQASASSIGHGYSSNTTKFSLKTGDVIDVTVTFDSISFGPSYVKPKLYTTGNAIDMPQFKNEGAGQASFSGKSFTSTYTADADYDITELFIWFRVFGDTSNASDSYVKMTMSVKVNGKEVLGA